MGISAPFEWQADPAKVTRVGVVLGGVFSAIAHRDPRLTPLEYAHARRLYSRDPAEIAGMAFDTDCGAVWVLDAGYALWFDADDPAYAWHELSADGAICGLVAQVRGEDGAGHGLPLCIFKPSVNDAWGIGGLLGSISNARTLAEGVALAAFALGQQLRFSPSYTGNAILRRVLADYEQDKDARLAAEDKRAGRKHETYTIPQPSQATRELCMEHRPSPVQWRCSEIGAAGHEFFGDDEDVFQVHIYDRNMSYVSSAREVPVGDPIPTKEFHRGCPGVYLVSNMRSMEHWMWEPELRDYTLPEGVYIVEGYYWPKTAKLDLRLWQDRIWDARRAARGVDSLAGRIAEAIVKKAGVATVGRLIQRTGRKVCSEAEAIRDGLRILNYQTDDSGNDTGNVEVIAPLGREDMAWPHVWSTIISSANERLEHAIATYAPHDTILAYIDQFYCLSRHSALDDKLDPMKTGGWKYSGSFPVPVADLEQLNTLSAQGLVKAFAAYQRQHGMRGTIPQAAEVDYGE